MYIGALTEDLWLVWCAVERYIAVDGTSLTVGDPDVGPLPPPPDRCIRPPTLT
jgi:hypothetical protein